MPYPWFLESRSNRNNPRRGWYIWRNGQDGSLHAVGRRIRELCRQYGISDCMPRPIMPGDKRALNKRVVEALANQVYTMELESAPGQRIWAYRKAAWAIEDLEQEVGLIYRAMERKGLESIENVGVLA